MTLKIISAEDVLFEGEVTLVALPGVMGQFTVLQNHATLISVLTAGNIESVADGQRESLPVNGGLVSVDNNVISVCIY